MTEFKHWLDESSDADDFERAVLRSDAGREPSEAEREQVWSRVLGSLALAPLGATLSHAGALKPELATLKASVSATKLGAVCLGVGKGFIVGLALYGAATGVGELSARITGPARIAAHPAPSAAFVPKNRGAAEPAAERRTELSPSSWGAPANASAEPDVRAPTLAAPSTRAPVLTLPPSEAPSVAAFEDPPLSTVGRDATAPRASQLEAEAAALRQARAELKAGQLSKAFATLEVSGQFPAPELVQEREALLIELLYRSGQASVAALRAKSFLQRFPDSPHADQVRTLSVSR